MTKYQDKIIDQETPEEYEGYHTNFVGNKYEEEGTLDKAMHDFFVQESEKEL